MELDERQTIKHKRKRELKRKMKYLSIVLLISVIYFKTTSKYRKLKEMPTDKIVMIRNIVMNGEHQLENYGVWLSECDSIRSVTLDKEFTERRKKQQREKAIQDSIEAEEYANVDFDLDAMWENTVWEEIQDVVDVVAEVEQITAVAGVRGAEAEDEALEHLYY